MHVRPYTQYAVYLTDETLVTFCTLFVGMKSPEQEPATGLRRLLCFGKSFGFNLCFPWLPYCRPAGLTAGLCIQKLLQMGATPAQGKVVVTGATGAVGSVAVELLARLGFDVVAISGKPAVRRTRCWNWARSKYWGVTLSMRPRNH